MIRGTSQENNTATKYAQEKERKKTGLAEVSP
jgi:hypothetical protein